MKYDNEEYIKITSERFNEVVKKYGKPDSNTLESKGYQRSHFSEWRRGKRKLTYEKAKDIIRDFYPDVLIEYIMGDSPYMTESERIFAIQNMLNQASIENNLLTIATINLLRASGYSVNTYFEEGLTQKGNFEKILDEIKNYCTISKNGKTTTLGISQLNNFANLICDYTEFMTERLF